VVNTYPTSAKAPDAMLNIASCYIDQKDKVKAKATLQNLIKKYPDSASAGTAKDRLAALK
jgi:TolA-binding protein